MKKIVKGMMKFLRMFCWYGGVWEFLFVNEIILLFKELNKFIKNNSMWGIFIFLRVFGVYI